MTLKIYQVHGTRQPVIIFAFTPEEAVAQARERGLVNPWEKLEAGEIPLPKGYRLIYDPLVGAMEQAALPFLLEEAPPELASQHYRGCRRAAGGLEGWARSIWG